MGKGSWVRVGASEPGEASWPGRLVSFCSKGLDLAPPGEGLGDQDPTLGTEVGYSQGPGPRGRPDRSGFGR